MRTIHPSLPTLAGAAAALVFVTACNNDRSMAPTTPVLSQAQAESLATTVVTDIVGEIGTATMDGSAGSGLGATASLSWSAPAGAATPTPGGPTESPPPVVQPHNDRGPPSGRF